MWSRPALLRLFFVIFACMSVSFLPSYASPQTIKSQHLPSALYSVGDQCTWGYTSDNGQCLPVRIPDNAFLDSTGHDWECERGYKRSSDQCVAVQVPAHAYLDYFGHDWVCMRGYKHVGSQCSRIELPVHAHLDYSGNDWECNPGYQRAADTCQAAWALPVKQDAEIFSAVPSPEIKRLVRQVQQQLKQAGYDPGPIDGILGPKTLAALERYMGNNEPMFVHDAPSRQYSQNGEKG